LNFTSWLKIPSKKTTTASVSPSTTTKKSSHYLSIKDLVFVLIEQQAERKAIDTLLV
jgi:hypothetical protein